MGTETLVMVGLVIGAVLVLAVLLRMLWRVAEPNEAMIISGLGARGRLPETADSMGFKIVTGKGALLLPGFQTARRLSLDTRGANLQVSCVTKQGLPVTVRAVVIYKVADDFASIANAARRFLDQQATMNNTIHELFAGHLRSIVGGLTIEEMIHNRDALTGEVRVSSATEMSKLGLIVDSLQIQEIDDESGYIANLGKPHAAAVAAAARIAEAQRDQEATQAEQIAAANKAAALRDTQLKKSAYQAEMDEAQARAQQAGPLALATTRQQVVVQETRAAQLEADLAEQRLQSQVRKPADANAYQTRVTAEADRDARVAQAEGEARQTELRAAADATKIKTAAAAEAEATKARGLAAAEATRATGEADAASARARGLAGADASRALGLAQADAAKAQGLAEAEAIKARAAALADNQDAVIAQQLAENWPQIVEAGAKAFGNVDNMVVLNGADGMGELFAKALTLGGTGLGLARSLLSAMGQEPSEQRHATNGVVPVDVVPLEVPPSPQPGGRV
jgi:flotillin